MTAKHSKAQLIFYRPFRVSSTGSLAIIGTRKPDQVLVKLKNGHWYKTDYDHYGQRQFIAGVDTLSDEPLSINIIPGRAYYFKCSIVPQQMLLTAKVEEVEEIMAQKEIAKLYEQPVIHNS